MRIYLATILLILSFSFQTKKETDEIPNDLKKSSILILIRNFNQWKHTINRIPIGYDEYAQHKMFEDYEQTIIKVENLFMNKGIKYSKKLYSDTINTLSVDYILDYKINCTGGEREKDWWMCMGGFYFFRNSDRKIFEPFGTDKRVLKILKRIK